MSLPSSLIRFGEWLPDLPALNNPGMTLVENALPTATSYTQVCEPEYRGDALDSRVLAATWAIAGGGAETAVFAGTADALYRQTGTATWADVSISGGYTADVSRWDMVSFGRRVIATTEHENTQYYDVGDSSNFADLPNAPSATAVGLVRDFVVLGNIANLGENYVQWSGFNNSEAWTPSRTTQSDFQPLASRGGRVQAIVSGSEAHIFLENTVYRMTYIGPPRIFRFDEIGPGRGTASPKSVVRLGPYIFYYDPAGFYQLDIRNSQFQAIGQNKVDRWFSETVPSLCAVDMQATVDPVNKLIIWAFCTDSSQTENSHILAYHYELKRWTLLAITCDLVTFLPSPSASLDDLSILLSPGTDSGGETILGNVDDHSISVDSDLFSGAGLEFAIFGANHQLGTLTGVQSLPARFSTAEFGAKMNNRLYTNLQRPYIEYRSGETGGSVQISHRDELNVAPQLTAPHQITDRGATEAKICSRFQQYHLTITGGFSDVLGLEVFAR